MTPLDPDIERIEEELRLRGVTDMPLSNKPEVDILEMQKPKPAPQIIPPIAVSPRVRQITETLVDRLKGAPTLVDKLKGIGQRVLNQVPGVVDKAMKVSQGVTDVLTAPIKLVVKHLGWVREQRVNAEFEKLKKDGVPVASPQKPWINPIYALAERKDSYTDIDLRDLARQAVEELDMVKVLAAGLQTPIKAATGFLYHPTSPDQLTTIAKQGLIPSLGKHGMGVYFEPTVDKATQGGALLRIKDGVLKGVSGLPEIKWVTKPVSPKVLEVYTQKGWVPLLKYIKQAVSQLR